MGADGPSSPSLPYLYTDSVYDQFTISLVELDRGTGGNEI